MKKITLFFACVLITAAANAEVISMTKIPTGWKLENYLGDALVVFFSGSMCEHGRLSFPASATNDDKNRFWSLILAAKALKSKVFIQYRDDAACTLVSFATVD